MKKTIGISTIIAILLAFVVLAAPTSDNPWIGAHNPLTGSLFTGTVGYWEFEGTPLNSTNITVTPDETGVNNGTVNGSTHTAEGRVGSAFEFDGDDDFIQVVKSDSLDLDNEITISAWAKANLGEFDTPSLKAKYIVGKSEGVFDNIPYLIAARDDTDAYFFQIWNGTDKTVYQTSIPDSNWHHLVLTYNGSQMRSYLDGALKDTSNLGNGIGTNNNDLYIGGFTGRNFVGNIDEVHIWNRSLSTAEISRLYNTSRGDYAYRDQDLGGAANNTVDSVKNIYNWYVNGTSIAVLNMPFEASGTLNATDYSGFGNNGTPTGNPLWNATGGYDGKGAFEYDGVDDYINVSKKLTSDNAFSVSAWAKRDNSGDTGDIVVSGGSGTVGAGTTHWFIGRNPAVNGNMGLCAFKSGQGWVCASSGITDTDWHHYGGVINATHLILYADGAKSVATGVVGAGYDKILIGRMANSGAIAAQFNGTIDDLIIFNRSLSAAQIKALYENKTNFIANEETALGDVWRVDVTPNSGQANTDGPTEQSEGMPIVDDSNLTVSDTETDCSTNVLIAALYTNNSGTPIVGASCNLTFEGDATIYGMSFNNSHYINDTKTFLTEGVVPYNVSCDQAGHFAQEANDSVVITGVQCDAIAAIPEFSTVGLLLAVIVIGLASVLIIRKKRRQ